MSKSRFILEQIGANLASYLNDPLIKIEFFSVPFTELEIRGDIRYARIAIYEQPETTTSSVDADVAVNSNQRYGMDISVVRAYKQNDSSRGEFPLGDVRDRIIDWARTFDAALATDAYIYTFGYKGNTALVRESKYVSRTLNFSAIRDLHKPQS